MWSLIAGNGRVLTKHPALICSLLHLTKPRRVTHQPWRFGEMKRKATDSSTDPKAKRQREPEVDYCDVVPRKDGQGNAIWPASEQSIERATDFIKEW